MSPRNRAPSDLSPGARATKAAQHALGDAAHETAFREMLLSFLEAGPRPDLAPAMALLSALANGIVLLREAAAFAAALANAVKAGDGAYIYFEGHGGRARCVKLNPIALIARSPAHGSTFNADDALRSFVDWLDRHGPALFQSDTGGRTAQLAAVERGAQCFWSHHPPRMLLNDSLAVLTLRPLRLEALARLVTGEPLARGAPLAPSLYAASASMLASAASFDGIEVRHRVVDIMTSGDGTKLAALRSQQLQLLEPLLDEAEDDVLALMLLTVASGICEWGTVLTETPSHSISSRYVREFDRMLSAEPELAASVTSLDPPQRRGAYETLLKHAKDPSDGRAALTTADMHLCDALGCEPVGPLQGGPDPAPRRPSRYLSPNEKQLVRRISPTLAPTPDQAVVLRAVTEVACSSPTRPGDLIDAMFEDLEIHGGRAVLNLRRRLNRKGPKTATAEGPLEFFDPDVVAALATLKAHREGQSAVGDDDPLWGRDLTESRRLYTRACALIDLTCKQVSGDPFESFYSLRHANVSQAVYEALMLDDPEQAQAALKRASFAARHRNVETTVENYFHLGAEVAHRHVLRGMGSLLTSSIASVWSGVGRNALDQRVSRSEAPRADVLWEAFAETAPLQSLRDVTADVPCAPMRSQPAVALLKLDDIVHSSVCAQLRFVEGKPSWDSEYMATAVATDWGRRLVAARTRYAAQWESDVRSAAVRQAKLRPIARRLARFGDSAGVREATALWRRTAKRGFVDVSDGACLTAWLGFLVTSGVPASRLVLRVDPAAAARLEFLSSVFSSITGLLPLAEEVPAGKGRPSAYLMISSADPVPGKALPSAATSMVGFNALMLAACIREDLLDPTHKVEA